MHIGIVANPHKEGARGTILALTERFQANQIQYTFEADSAKIVDQEGVNGAILAKQVDMVVVLGGDGTMLDAVYRLDYPTTPIVGINIGTLGFLTSCTHEELDLFIENILNEKYRVVPRTLLEATVTHTDGSTETHTALNEITINRGHTGRLASLEVKINGDFLNDYRADGLIVSTPTGSTAYSLAAGGPLLSPLSQVFVITPICPHSLTNRSLVLANSSIVEISSNDNEENLFTVDGRVVIKVAAGGSVEIKNSPKKVHIVRFDGRSFFSTLRQKFHWGN